MYKIELFNYATYQWYRAPGTRNYNSLGVASSIAITLFRTELWRVK